MGFQPKAKSGQAWHGFCLRPAIIPPVTGLPARGGWSGFPRSTWAAAPLLGPEVTSPQDAARGWGPKGPEVTLRIGDTLRS